MFSRIGDRKPSEFVVCGKLKLMANKQSFTSTEWDTVRNSPFLAGFVVVAADPSGPIGLFKESAAVSRMVLNELKNHGTELMQALATDLKENVHMPRLDAKSMDDVKAGGLKSCADAMKLVREKATPQEAVEFKAWLTELAKRVAEASKEGGIFGFGGTLVSDAEKNALNDIQSALA